MNALTGLPVTWGRLVAKYPLLHPPPVQNPCALPRLTFRHSLVLLGIVILLITTLSVMKIILGQDCLAPQCVSISEAWQTAFYLCNMAVPGMTSFLATLRVLKQSEVCLPGFGVTFWVMCT